MAPPGGPSDRGRVRRRAGAGHRRRGDCGADRAGRGARRMAHLRRARRAHPDAGRLCRVHRGALFLGLYRPPAGASPAAKAVLRALQFLHPVDAGGADAGQRRPDVDCRRADDPALGLSRRLRGHPGSARGGVEIRRPDQPRRDSGASWLSHSLLGLAASPATSRSPGSAWSRRRRTCRRHCCGRPSC